MTSSSTIWVVGSLNADLVQRVKRLPNPGETISGGDLQTFSGGKGANQAYAAARLGARVNMVGCVGGDELGAFLLREVEASGVDVSRVSTVDSPTGVATILVSETGGNSIVVSPGANARLTPDTVVEKLEGMTRNDFLLCQLETPIDTVGAALKTAKQINATTILDPAPPEHFSVSYWYYADILTPNESETVALSGSSDPSASDLKGLHESVVNLWELGAGDVVLKLGSAGCYYAQGRESGLVAGFAVDAVDTTAAGDTFNAALAIALSEKESMASALRFANAAAALSVTKPGARASMPTRIEVEALLKKGDA